MRFLLIFIGAFSLLSGFAAHAEEIIFRRQNNMGFVLIDKLERNENVFKFNGKVLGEASSEPLIMAFGNFSKAAESPHKSFACASGHYTYTKKQMGDQKTFSGCTEGPIYREISLRLDTIRKWPTVVAKGPQ